MQVWRAYLRTMSDRLGFLCLTSDTQMLELFLGLDVLFRGSWIVIWEWIPGDSALGIAAYQLILGMASALIWGLVLSIMGLVRICVILAPHRAYVGLRFWCAIVSSMMGFTFVLSFIVVRPASLGVPFHLTHGILNALIAARLQLLWAERRRER